MTARVHLTGSDTRNGALVLSGRVVSGEIGAGMLLVVPLNSALGAVAKIDAVERGDGAEVRLVFRDPETAETLAALGVGSGESDVRAAG